MARGRLFVRRGVGDVRVAFLPVLLEEFVFKLFFLSAQVYTCDGVLGLSLNLEKHPHRALSVSLCFLNSC